MTEGGVPRIKDLLHEALELEGEAREEFLAGLAAEDAAAHARVVELVADLGFEAPGVLLAATHTHSGVGCYLRSRFAQLVRDDGWGFVPHAESSITSSSTPSGP